jgi:L-alanine-DL-glutamate epimerase-like enolase superfamily enzyme
MRIVGARLTAVAVPYRSELGTVVTSGLRLTEARHLLVELVDDEGRVGIGEAVPRPSVYGETLDGQVAALTQLLLPPVIGLDPHRTEAAWAAWARVVGNHSAKAAVDVAMHDLVARAAGQPLHRLLGGAGDGTSIALTMALGMGEPAALADGARAAIDEGFAAVKLKVGSDPTVDIAAVRAVRDAVGPDAMVYVDANGGYTRVEARRVARAFEAAGIALFEEPLPPTDRAGRADLARRTDIPLLLDESTNELGRVLDEVAAGSVAGFSLRAARGGITRNRHLAGIAVAAGIGCLVGSHRELGPGVAANAHLAAGLPAIAWSAELGSHRYLEDSLLIEPLRMEGGRLYLPAGAGLGVALDPERVARYRLSSTTVGDVR